KELLEEDEEADRALDLEGTAQQRRRRVLPTLGDSLEERPLPAHDAVGRSVPSRDGDVALADLDEPALGLPPVDELATERAGGLREERLAPPAPAPPHETRGPRRPAPI